LKQTYVLIILLVFVGCTALPYKNTHLNITDSPPNKICVIGDTGTGKKLQYRVANELFKENCDSVFLVGDIVYPGGIKSSTDYQLRKKFFRPYEKLLQKEDPTPFYLVLGNHDYMGTPEAWIDVAKDHSGKIVFPHHFYSGQWEDLCFIVIDTNPGSSLFTWGHSSLIKTQNKWLKEINRKFKKNCQLKLAFGHHPYLSSGLHGNAKGDLKELLENNILGQYHAYFAGHDHNLAYEGKQNSTHLFVSGAGGKLRRLKTKYQSNDKYNDSKFGYLVLHIKRDDQRKLKAHYEFKVLEKLGVTTSYSGTIKP
jgi:3',5'-cyclic AMP phosphodiesterase CpdA